MGCSHHGLQFEYTEIIEVQYRMGRWSEQKFTTQCHVGVGYSLIEYTVLGLSIDWESLFIDMYSPALLISVWRQAIDHSASIISSIILLGQDSGQLSIILDRSFSQSFYWDSFFGVSVDHFRSIIFSRHFGSIIFKSIILGAIILVGM